MAITHVKDGDDFFSGSHRGSHESFGFHGSLNPLPTTGEKSQRMDFADTKTSKRVLEPTEMGEGSPNDYATGGHVHPHQHPHGHRVHHVEEREGMKVEHHEHGGMTMHHHDGRVTHHHHDGSPVHAASGGHMGAHMHPHGHHVAHVEHREHDGAVVHHHHHGGHSVHHPDGRITHHHQDGSPVHSMHGGMEQMHDHEGEYAHGGHARDSMRHPDAAQDRHLIKEMITKHDRGEHLATGGRARLPHGMKPPGMHPHSPIETPPRKPQMTRSPTNQMAGGVMPYGSQPSDEPGYEPGGADGSTPPPFRHGGKVRRHEHE